MMVLGNDRFSDSWLYKRFAAEIRNRMMELDIIASALDV